MPSIKVIEARNAAKGTDPTGELSSGELLIKGRGMKMRVYHGSGSDVIGKFGGGYGGPSLYLLRGNETPERPCGVFRIRCDYEIAAPGQDHILDGSELIIAKLLEEARTLVSWIPKGFMGSLNPVASSWLILQNSKHHLEAFERIGNFGIGIDFGLPNNMFEKHFYLQIEKAYRASPEVETRII